MVVFFGHTPNKELNNKNRKMKQFTKEEKEDFAHVLGLSRANVARDVDLTDPRQKRFYLSQLRVSGVHSKDHPELYRRIEKIATGEMAMASSVANPSGQPVNVIGQLSAASAAGQVWDTSAISSIAGGTTVTKITLGLYDGDYNLIGTAKTVDQYTAGQSVTVQATGDFGSPMPAAGREVISLATIHWTDEVGAATHLQNVFVSSINFPKQINNQSPLDTNADNKIIVCLTRNGGNCDYSKAYAGKIEVPVQGSIVYNGNIDLVGGKPVNATNLIEIARTVQGGNPISPPAGFDFFESATISGDTITWDFTWLDFGPANFTSGDQVYYVFSVTLDVGGQQVIAFITNAPSSYTPGGNQFNTILIDPMYIYFGCMAAGTRIAMGDGTEKPIELVEVGDTVVSNLEGNLLRVENTVTGTEEDPMILVKTSNGLEVLLTDGHPVITKRGVTLAKQLRIDSQVLTQNGWSTLTGLDKIDYSDTVHNLQLAPINDTDQHERDQNTMFAGGIQVGDQQMQWHYNSPSQQTIEDLLANTDEVWHKDIMSSYHAGNLDIAKKMTS